MSGPTTLTVSWGFFGGMGGAALLSGTGGIRLVGGAFRPPFGLNLGFSRFAGLGRPFSFVGLGGRRPRSLNGEELPLDA